MATTTGTKEARGTIFDWIEEAGATTAAGRCQRTRVRRQHARVASTIGTTSDHHRADEWLYSIFSVPWNTLSNALETMADSHHAFANNIETDVEKPLRSFASTNREMTAMSTIQGNLASMARDIENAEKKNDRLAAKGKKAQTMNVANATSDLETAQSQWDSQAPYVFEQLQAVDETRLNQLRDVLTQFQTHEVDRVEKDRTLAEQCLNMLLNVETADEIKTFALRVTQGGASRPGTMQRQRSRQSVIGPSVPSLAAPAHHQLQDDAASQRSGSSTCNREDTIYDWYH